MRYFYYTCLIWLCACGSASTDGDNPTTVPFQESLLSLVGFGGSVLNPQKRFSGYARSSKRVTVIDPSTKQEIWGRTVGANYAAAFPLHDFSGVALLGEDKTELDVLTGDQDFNFSLLGYASGFFARAGDDFAFAAWADADQVVKTIRFTKGAWQEQTFSNPIVDESAIAAGTDRMVGMFKPDGSRYVGLHPPTGSYFVLDINDDGTYDEPTIVCQRSDTFAYRAMTYDSATNHLFVGNEDGTLYAFSTDECAGDNPPPISLHQGFPVTDAILTDTSLVAVTQAGGWFHLFRFDGTKFQEEFSLANVCPYPRGALNVDDKLSLAVCYDPDNFDPTLDAKEAPSIVQYKDAYLVTVDREAGAVLGKIEVDPETTAGMAVDADSRDLVLLNDSSLGNLIVIDLETEKRSIIRGVFLDDILNQ